MLTKVFLYAFVYKGFRYIGKLGIKIFGVCTLYIHNKCRRCCKWKRVDVVGVVKSFLWLWSKVLIMSIANKESYQPF